MAKVHGKNTFVSVAGTDLSQYCDNSELPRTADSHDVTGYGKSAHVYAAGLVDGKFSLGGFYDSTLVTGPRAVLDPLVGAATPTTIIRRPEGTGTGKPQQTFTANLLTYTESNPVADMVRWVTDWQLSDAVTGTVQ